MPLTVTSLNGDTSFLLTFTSSPPSSTSRVDSPTSSSPPTAKPVHVLIDPWLLGRAQILHPKISTSAHRNEPSVTSLADLPDPDVVIISQDKPDHCHEATLRTLRHDTRAMVLAPRKSARKIRRWGIVPAGTVRGLRRFKRGKGNSVARVSLGGGCEEDRGELEVANITQRWDFTGLHNAVGVVWYPPHPSDCGQPKGENEKKELREQQPLSIVYSPHGIGVRHILPYIRQCLNAPLTALIHSFDEIQNPCILGGTINAGFSGGCKIAEALKPRVWIGAHDEVKDDRGLAVRRIRRRRFGVEEVRMLARERMGEGKGGSVEIVRLGPGGEWSGG